MTYPGIQLELPAWIADVVPAKDHVYESDEAKMALVIELSRRNVTEKTGGPFAAAVFDEDSHQLVAPGVNLVVEGQCSSAHAEIVALSVAQRALQTHDLGAAELSAHVLVSSTEPCAMCLGAIPWSGVRRLVCGATGEDAEAIGMDEGAKPFDWTTALSERGISVLLGLQREDAAQVLRDYADSGALIYNGRGAEETKPKKSCTESDD